MSKAMRVEEDADGQAVNPNPRATIGGNNPPLKEYFADINQNLPEQLAADAKELVDRVQALIDGEGRMPKRIADGDDETAAKVVAFQGQVQKCIKEAEAKRVDLTEGPLASQRIIMGFYRENVFAKLGETTADKRTGKRGGMFDRVSDVLTDFEKRKADIERRLREEAEQRAREAAAAAERARQEAERQRLAAEAAERRRREEEERRIRAEEEARLAKVENERQLKREIERQEKERAEREARARQAEEEARQKAEAERLAAEAAERARQDAEAAAAAAAAKTSTLSKTAGLHGSSSSLRKNWKARITDHDALKADPKAMAQVWEYIKPEAIEDAVNRIAKLKENTVKLPGVEFYDQARATVRA